MYTLETESKAFEKHLPDLLKGCDGQWAVIKGEEVRQVLPTYEAALTWAYETFGIDRFFVKQVNAVEPIAHFSRRMGPCAQ